MDVEKWLRERLDEAMREEAENKEPAEPEETAEAEPDEGDNPNVYPLW